MKVSRKRRRARTTTTASPTIAVDRVQPFGFKITDPDGSYLTRLSRREAMALAATAAGRVRWTWRRTYTPYWADAHLELTCDDFGIGYATLTNVQRTWHRDGDIVLIADHGDDEGPAHLTPLGEAVLDALADLRGFAHTAPMNTITSGSST